MMYRSTLATNCYASRPHQEIIVYWAVIITMPRLAGAPGPALR